MLEPNRGEKKERHFFNEKYIAEPTKQHSTWCARSDDERTNEDELEREMELPNRA